MGEYKKWSKLLDQMLRMDLLKRVKIFDLRQNTKNAADPKQKLWHVFTLESQHQEAETVEEIFEIVLDFEQGKRNWQVENWPSTMWNKEAKEFADE